MLKAEMLKPEKPPQCDIKATTKRVDSQLIGTPKPRQCDPKAARDRVPVGLRQFCPACARAQIQNDILPGGVYCSRHSTGIPAETKARYARRANGSVGSRRRAGRLADRYPAGRSRNRGEDH